MMALGRFLWFLPRNILIGMLIVYRKMISPLYGDVCRYYPSCSSYGQGALQQHGVLRGIAFTTWRLIRCHPWAAGGVDDVPARRAGAQILTRLGFVSAHGTETPQDSLRTSLHAFSHSHGKG